MRQGKGGSIVNTASVAGLIGLPQHFAYYCPGVTLSAP
jgi:short-subunit dehydrogenase